MEYYPMVAVDAAGAMYVRGFTYSGDFPPEMGAQPRTDDFVTKLSPDGSSLIYTAFFPGDFLTSSFHGGIFVDAKGFVYLSGGTKSAKFPLKNPFQSKFEGGFEGYVLKLSRDGLSLVYSSYLGGHSDDYCLAVVVDASGAAYIGGLTTSKDFPVRKPFRNTLAGNLDGFVAKVSPQGGNLVYSTYIGGTHWDLVVGIVVDAQGSAVMTGMTESPNFPVKSAFQKSLGGARDAFVAKLAPAGNALVYSSYFGGNGVEIVTGLALDGTGAAYIGGMTSGEIPVRNPFQSARKGTRDGFYAKIASNGRSVIYASYLGGTGMELIYGLAVDVSGALYLAGSTESSNFPVKSPFQASRRGSEDAILTVVDPGGAKLLYSTYLGGIYKDSGWGIALGGDGAIFLSGMTNSPDLPVLSSGAYQGALDGKSDAFIFKFTQVSAPRRD